MKPQRTQRVRKEIAKLITRKLLCVALRSFFAFFAVMSFSLVAVGYFADVIVFDEKTVADCSTYEQPELLAVGMRYVIVNGKLAVEDGKHTGALVGRPLRKTKP